MITSKNGLPLLHIILTEEQTTDLARSVVSCAKRYYENPENEEKFQQWLKERNRTNSEPDGETR